MDGDAQEEEEEVVTGREGRRGEQQGEGVRKKRKAKQRENVRRKKE